MPRKPPAFPVEVMGLGGPITVEIADKLTDEDGGHCWGLWMAPQRLVKIERHTSRDHMWATLYHELIHAALDDSGLSNMLTEPQQEALCDALATARIRERFGAGR